MAAVVGPALSESRPAADLSVSAYMDYQGGGDQRPANLAKAIASKMLRKIGVMLIWVDAKSCPADGIHITLTGQTPATLQPGALAYALPYEGTHIQVFRDRIEANQPALVPHLLAHVLVHEVIHILEGCTRHSDRGVMKAHWGGADFNQMLWSELPISHEDIDLIHLGMKRRVQLAAPQTNQDGLAGNPAPTLVAALQLP
jgi:hypothetical protein